MTPLRPRRATVADAGTVATLLDDFNREFDTATPGPDVLTERLQRLLSGEHTVALLVGEPAVGVALVTLRANVWNDGPVALLDELYVVPSRRNEGLGTLLVTAVAELVAEREGELIEVNVDEGDVDAQRFYERHGFSVIDPDTDERAFYFYREL